MVQVITCGVERINLDLFTCVKAVNNAGWRRQAPGRISIRGIQRLQYHVGGLCVARQIAGHCGAEAAFLCVQAIGKSLPSK